MMKQSGFSKSVRLLKSEDFERVFSRKNSASDRCLVLYVAAGLGAETRIGLVVSRKCGNAVQRNRWKRALREAFRRVRLQLPQPLDLVVIPRAGDLPKLDVLRESLLGLTKRAVRQLPPASSDQP